jgi:arginase family enzyme
MEELAGYFEAVNEKKHKSIAQREGFYGSVLSKHSFKNISDATKLVLIGLSETRNAFEINVPGNSEIVREYFYQLAAINRIEIVDLGNLKSGKKVQDTYAALKHITSYFIGRNIIPVIYGGTQDLTLPMVQGVFNQQSSCELVIADALFDLSNDVELHSKNYIGKLHQLYAEKLEQSVVAYQSYLTSSQQQRFLSDNSINTMRLGLLRNGWSQVEPLLRDADLLSFDLSSIRFSDCPGALSTGPNGLYAEEACQLVHLAGISDKLKAVGIFDFQPERDIHNQTAQLIAQLIWHFIQGVSQRKGDWPAKPIDQYKKIYVKVEKTESDLVFYQNAQNNRYWIELPDGQGNQTRIVSCSEKDYKDICNNEIPERIWKSISRILK